MTQLSPLATRNPGYRIGLPARLVILAAAFFAEKIFLNTLVNFERADTAEGLGAMVRVAQHWGFRFLVAFAAAVVLFAYVRGGGNLKSTATSMQEAPTRIGWVCGHLLLVIALAPLSYFLFRYPTSDVSLAIIASLWTLTAVTAMLAAFLAMAPFPLWLKAGRSLGVIWSYAALAALFGTGAMQLTQSLWRPTAALTFELVRHLLGPIVPGLITDPVTLVLRTPRFAVQIADVCSGLEGVGLMLAFSVAWLLYFRREYIFPRALLLIPAGVVAIFLLNVLRITALILIGDAGYPDVAVYGFHSQAGWIAFIAVACGLVLLSRRSAWLTRTAVHPDNTAAMHNPTAAYLMPLLAILGVGHRIPRHYE